jgi:hypothetical protein
MNLLKTKKPSKWYNSKYQYLEFIEYELSLGPNINVFDISGKLFDCKLMELKNYLIKHIDNFDELKISIIINDSIIQCPYIDTLIFMLEYFITDDIEELNINIVIEEKSYFDYDFNDFNYDYRSLKVNNFFEKLRSWKNKRFCKIMITEYQNKKKKYFDFLDQYLNNCKKNENVNLYHIYYDDVYEKESNFMYNSDWDGEFYED